MKHDLPIPTERQVQRSILAMIRSCFRECVYHHSPNGAHLAGNETARFKQMGALLGDGLKRGWPDLVIVWPDKGIAFIEVKRSGKKAEAHQAELHGQLRGFGFPCEVCTSPEEAYVFLRDCGAPCSAEMIGVAA